jgi:hypothetical protein
MLRQVDRRPSWWGAATLVAFVLASCGGPAPSGATNRLSIQIDLRTTHVVAGHEIKGVLVVHNPHAAIDLTKVVRGHCQPGFAVILTKGSFHNYVGFAASCVSAPFVISHGMTRLPFTVTTSYNECLGPGGSSVNNVPRCLSADRSPPLPRGSYDAVIEWSTTVPLPKPTPVAVTLT